MSHTGASDSVPEPATVSREEYEELKELVRDLNKSVIAIIGVIKTADEKVNGTSKLIRLPR